mgnify:CR=1 FL=1
MKHDALSEVLTFRTTKRQKKRAQDLCRRFRKLRLSQADIVRAGFDHVLALPDPDAFLREQLSTQQ